MSTTSRPFVDALRHELPTWLSEGLVSEREARAIAIRYGLPAPAGAPAEAGRARPRTAAFAASGALSILLALAAALLLRGIGDGVFLPLAALAAAFAATPLVVHGADLSRAAERVRTLGRLLFYALAYLLSFATIAETARYQNGLFSEGLVAALPPLLVAAAAVATGHKRAEVDAHARGEAMLLVATCVAFGVGLALDTGNGTALVATMSLAFLAVGRIVRGLALYARRPFLEGLAVAAVVVASRGFDVFPSRWLSVGIAVAVAAGASAAVTAFERRRARSLAPAGARPA